MNAYVSYTLGDNVEILKLLGTANLKGTGNGLENALAGMRVPISCPARAAMTASRAATAAIG